MPSKRAVGVERHDVCYVLQRQSSQVRVVHEIGGSPELREEPFHDVDVAMVDSTIAAVGWASHARTTVAASSIDKGRGTLPDMW